MPPPLTTDGQVEYQDGTKPTVNQMATDVAAFLVWTAEPNLMERRHYGFAVVVFLLFATILGYLAYHQLWYEAKRTVRPTGPLDPENQAKTRRAKAKAGVAG
jgi:ubiquinol-cytochrome c reductase cytochrome c1 subunit